MCIACLFLVCDHGACSVLHWILERILKCVLCILGSHISQSAMGYEYNVYVFLNER